MERQVAPALLLALLTLPLPATAQSGPADTPALPQGVTEEEEAPPPPVVLRAIPPRHSWEFGFQVSYGLVPGFPYDAPYVGFGLRGGWGRHFGRHRVGVGLDLTMEGAVTVRWAHAIEPQILWDYVHPKGLYLGASLGPVLSIGVNSTASQSYDVGLGIGPMAALRLGYSQQPNLVARRFFVAVEPKVRYTSGNVTGLVSIVLGTGRGY